MALEIKKNTLSVRTSDSKSCAKQSIDTQINLPDYCSDIKRILKCCVEPGISSVSVKGEKIGAVGGVVIRLIYINDDDNIDCCETQLDLDVSCEKGNLPENPVILAFPKTDYVNCRAMSQRRVSVNGSVAVNFTVLSESKREFVTHCDNMGIQLKKDSFKARNCVCQGSKSFDMSETVSLEGDSPDIGKILFSDAYCIVESKKTVTGKMLIKGELVCLIVYCPEKGDSKVFTLRHTMPISQIIDLAGVEEKSNCILKLDVNRFMVNAKADSSGKKRLVEISAKVTAVSLCREIKEQIGAVDCYSTDYEINFDSESIDFSVPVQEIKENRTVNKTYEIQGGMKEVCHIRAEDTDTKIQFENDKAKITLSSLLCIIYLNEKGIPSYLEKSFDLELVQNLPSEKGRLSGDVYGMIKNLSWSVTGKNNLSVSADVSVEGEICRKFSKKLCVDITVDEAATKKKDDCAVILYYPQKGEELWSIAKRYNTTIKLLEEENDLKNKETDDGMMLIVPTV